MFLQNRFEETIRELKPEQVRTVEIVGANEIAEILYLYSQTTKIEIKGIYDDNNIGNKWFEYIIEDFSTVESKEVDKIISVNNKFEFNKVKVVNF